MPLQQATLYRLAISITGLLLVVMAATSSSAQTANKVDAQRQAAPQVPWVVNCSNAQSGRLFCQMEQNLVSAETRQRLLGAVLFRRARDGKLVMQLALPHGIWLPHGVMLGIDGQDATRRVAIEYGDRNGSYVTVPVGDALLEKMKRGSRLTVSMRTRQDKDFCLELSLDRFTVSFIWRNGACAPMSAQDRMARPGRCTGKQKTGRTRGRKT